MRKRRRFLLWLGVLAVAWLAALLVLGVALEGRVRRGVAERVGESLGGEAAIAGGSLALVRGDMALDALTVRRDDLIGHLALSVARIDCALPPLGWALIDRGCRTLAIRGTRLELSSLALLKRDRPRRPPLAVGGLAIDDAHLELLASALAPNLGRVAIDIEHAAAGPTVMKTPLSWIFALRSLRATLQLPGDVTLRLDYAGGELRVAGGLFGATPVALPIALPVANLADDPAAEVARLVSFGKDLAQRLITQKAEDWLRSKLSP